jgi:hypothetical protein
MSAKGESMSEMAAKPMTVLTPIKRFRAKWLRLVLAVGRPSRKGRLARMAFIHAAHWAELDHLPTFRGQPPERPLPRYLLFVSNFNGPAQDYIEAFSDQIPGSIALIYKNCSAFPNAARASELAAYLFRHHHDPDLYYSAYPEATTRMILAAERVHDALDDLRTVAHKDPAAFPGAFDAFLRQVQADL